VRCDKGAAALLAQQDALGHELVDRLAYRADRDVEALGEPRLARDRFARLPFARREPAREAYLDFLIERVESEAPRRERVAHPPFPSPLR
jgi:hypothetical protein